MDIFKSHIIYLHNNQFLENDVKNGIGGGLSINNADNISIFNNTFSNNIAVNGGAASIS